MPSCLGLYIENNIIKYAKVSKEKDIKKVETFGIKFYTKLEEGIKQIIDETYSYKIPICINLTKETYDYFNMFALLKKADLEKAIDTEFDSRCTEKGFNSNALEGRYAVVEQLNEKEKLKVIYIATNKIELNKKIQMFEEYNLTNVVPLPIAITTLLEQEKNNKENSIIVNMEENTTFTTVINGKIYNVKTIEEGSQNILSNINLKENSYSKAYEVCKETTIYTSEGKELGNVETDYLEDIMPTLYSIVGQTQKVINESLEKIANIYLTGTGALINNIDLYFQEYLEGINCEILKPKFIKKTPNINIKDYIEVNSAISLGLMGLGEGLDEMNFKKKSLKNIIKTLLTAEVVPNKKEKKTKKSNTKKGTKKINTKKLNIKINNDLKTPLDKTEKMLLNVVIALIIMLTVFIGFSTTLKSQFKNKVEKVETTISKTNQEIQKIEQDSNNIKQQKSLYTGYIEELGKTTQIAEERNKVKGAIPGLLNQIMNVIPKGVQIKSIENTNGGKVEILVQSAKYEQIAFFIGSIKTDVILTDVISTSGQKNKDVITVKIEGVLP